jgi:hypothetical protein
MSGKEPSGLIDSQVCASLELMAQKEKVAAAPVARSVSTRVIGSLAILKANWDVLQRDYIENFVPFVAEVLRIAPQPEVSLPEIQRSTADKFGLRIPQGALKTILHRCAQQGLIKQQNKIYIRNDQALNSLCFPLDQADALRRHGALVDKLIRFCKERYQAEWTSEDADAALLEYLEERSPAILAAAVEGNPLPAPTATVQNAEFLVNAFIHHLSTTDPEGFAFLETIVKGCMLANVLIFPEIGKVQRRFERVEVYFDTGFVLGALGLEGQSRQDACRELLSLLYAQRARLVIFEHTRDEVIGVLDAAANNLRRGRKPSHMEFFEYLAGKEYKPSDIELVIAKLGDSLQSLRISVKRRPGQTYALGLDEKKLEATIDEEIQYRNERGRLFDLDSLTAIHRLRHGSSYTDVESCVAIFVTPNANLIRAAKKFFDSQYERKTVPLAIREDVLTTIVWLKEPMSAPDLPRKMIVSDCFAAMKPPDRLWKVYLEEINKLNNRGSISENDYVLLRHSIEARRALMDFTLGSPEGFTEGTITEVLAFAQNAIRAESAEALASADLALSTERSLRLKAELDKEKAFTAAQEVYEAQFARAREIATKVGAAARRVVLWACAPLILLATYFTLPRPFPQFEEGWWKYIVPSLLLILAVLTVLHLAFGTTLKDWTLKVELAVAGWTEGAVLKILKPAPLSKEVSSAIVPKEG